MRFLDAYEILIYFAFASGSSSHCHFRLPSLRSSLPAPSFHSSFRATFNFVFHFQLIPSIFQFRLLICIFPVLRIRDVYPVSRILIFTHSESRISDPKKTNKFHKIVNYFIFEMLKKKKLGQFSKNYRNFYPKKLSLSSQKYGLGSGSEIRNPEKTYSGTGIQGSKRHRIPDVQHCIFHFRLSTPSFSFAVPFHSHSLLPFPVPFFHPPLSAFSFHSPHLAPSS